MRGNPRVRTVRGIIAPAAIPPFPRCLRGRPWRSPAAKSSEGWLPCPRRHFPLACHRSSAVVGRGDMTGQRRRPRKVGADAKRPPVRKSAKEPRLTVRDLKKRLADAEQREAEALKRAAETLAQQTTTSD